MPRIKLSKDVSIRTFPAMPERVDPMTAELSTLQRYGFPHRPKQAYLQELWASTLRSRPQFVQPQLRVVPGEPAAAPDFVPAFLPAQTDSTLAGAFADAPEEGERVTWIGAEMTVPSLYTPANWQEAHEDDYKLEAWVAIHQNSDVSVWVGYIGQLTWENSKPVMTYKPTWQWAPDARVEIENFPVSAGDKVSCLVCVDPVFSSNADVYYHNLTEGWATHFRIDDYRNLRGTRAGWYVRPSIVTSEGPVLPYFASLYFDSCYAGTEEANILKLETPVHLQDLNTSKDILTSSLLSEIRMRIDHAPEEAR